MDVKNKIESLSFDAKKKLIRDYYAADVHRFFRDICYTLDEYDTTGTPIKKFPYHWPYMRDIVIPDLANPKVKWLFFWKSRQVMLTHTALAYCLWLALFHPGKKIAIQSKKADDADAHIQRMKVVYDNLPAWKPIADFSYCRIKVPELTSDVYGVPQGPDQLRQFSFSYIFSDEFGFQSETKEAFNAVHPIVNSGGKFVAATTPPKEKNFAYDCYRNAGKLFKVVELHYSMRPDRGVEWATEAKKGISQEDWDRENELKLIESGGKRVFAPFSIARHQNLGLQYNSSLPLLRGWDFGFHRPAVCFAQVDQNDRFVILNELVGRDVLIDVFADNVLSFTNIHFPGSTVRDYCDMAGIQVSDKSEKTSIQILQLKKIFPTYKKVLNDEDLFNLIRRKMVTLIGDKPSLQISPNATILIDGFSFGLIYKPDGITVVADGIDEDGEKEKGYYMHILDATKYIFYNIYNVKGDFQDRQQKLSALKNPYPNTKAPVNDWKWMDGKK